MNRRDGTAENWLITFTQTLRQQLPQGQYIITHAPVAPWFAGALYTSGAYATVNAKVGNLIDRVHDLRRPAHAVVEHVAKLGCLPDRGRRCPAEQDCDRKTVDAG
jgi:hypothetical protein